MLIFKYLGIAILLFLLYAIIALIHGTLTDFKPDEVVELKLADFYLFQEVDRKSKRSYKINAHEKYAAQLSGYASTYSINYKSARVPLPILEFWRVMGKMDSGLGTYSRFQPTEATRYQLPGEYPWPDRIFHLDRCFSLHRYPTTWGQELVVINTHNSAYDDGSLKAKQMAFRPDLNTIALPLPKVLMVIPKLISLKIICHEAGHGCMTKIYPLIANSPTPIKKAIPLQL